MDYIDFLRAKIRMASFSGFEIQPTAVHERLYQHQRDIVRWAVLDGRRAIFASFGLGKSSMQNEWMRLIVLQVRRPGLIVCPLGIRHELIAEAALLVIVGDVEAITLGCAAQHSRDRYRRACRSLLPSTGSQSAEEGTRRRFQLRADADKW
ncbi:hypothetical protein ACFFU8_18370 [Chromobacterium piscinae]|uniref:hypothetical protein n=1 Tax=Chromobacterium piscinae TaxID=686831 RepID=UPI001E4690A6|nr:hypothetical protein [Chromobacterium piscinae]MCD5326718.1 hypothetical protein [Chromobacterium piscinae]